MKVSKDTLFAHNQSFWQLASIQSVGGLNIPGIIIGNQLLVQYGLGTTIYSIIIGNLILWFIGVIIISMMEKNHINAIENIKNYIGSRGGKLVALMVTFTFISWYVLQIDQTISFLEKKSGIIWERASIIKTGAVLGLSAAVLSLGRIKLIKWLTTMSLPILFIYALYIFFSSTATLMPSIKAEFSFFGISSVVLFLLPGMVNLPTFFRHSRSKPDSYFALTIMVLFFMFFQICSLWINFNTPSPSMLYYLFPTALFAIILVTCNNLLNLYFASVFWETFIPRFKNLASLFIIGLVGTIAYICFQVPAWMAFYVELSGGYLTTLGSVLAIAFLIRIFVKHRPRPAEKLVNLFSWLAGCFTATFFKIYYPEQDLHSLLIGTATSALVFLVVIFIEETIWSIKTIASQKS